MQMSPKVRLGLQSKRAGGTMIISSSYQIPCYRLRIILSTTVNSSLWTGSDGIIIEGLFLVYSSLWLAVPDPITDAKSSATPTTFTNDVTCGFKGMSSLWK